MGGSLVRILPQIKQAKAMLGAIGNPQAMLNTLIQRNPQVQQIISQYGGVNEAISALCEKQGISPQEFMEALR